MLASTHCRNRLALFSHANIPVTFWPFAFTTVAYLINRLPTPTLHNLTPSRCLFQKEPNYSKLKNRIHLINFIPDPLPASSWDTLLPKVLTTLMIPKPPNYTPPDM
ncbi:hypothetical protein LXL04_020234 [Taraxacum kok-saghyz]